MSLQVVQGLPTGMSSPTPTFILSSVPLAPLIVYPGWPLREHAIPAHSTATLSHIPGMVEDRYRRSTGTAGTSASHIQSRPTDYFTHSHLIFLPQRINTWRSPPGFLIWIFSSLLQSHLHCSLTVTVIFTLLTLLTLCISSSSIVSTSQLPDTHSSMPDSCTTENCTWEIYFLFFCSAALVYSIAALGLLAAVLVTGFQEVFKVLCDVAINPPPGWPEDGSEDSLEVHLWSAGDAVELD